MSHECSKSVVTPLFADPVEGMRTALVMYGCRRQIRLNQLDSPPINDPVVG